MNIRFTFGIELFITTCLVQILQMIHLRFFLSWSWIHYLYLLSRCPALLNQGESSHDSRKTSSFSPRYCAVCGYLCWNHRPICCGDENGDTVKSQCWSSTNMLNTTQKWTCLFPTRWFSIIIDCGSLSVSRKSDIPWPPRSPYLSTCNLLWAFFKSRVCHLKLRTLAELWNATKN